MSELGDVLELLFTASARTPALSATWTRTVYPAAVAEGRDIGRAMPIPFGALRNLPDQVAATPVTTVFDVLADGPRWRIGEPAALEESRNTAPTLAAGSNGVVGWRGGSRGVPPPSVGALSRLLDPSWVLHNRTPSIGSTAVMLNREVVIVTATARPFGLPFGVQPAAAAAPVSHLAVDTEFGFLLSYDQARDGRPTLREAFTSLTIGDPTATARHLRPATECGADQGHREQLGQDPAVATTGSHRHAPGPRGLARPARQTDAAPTATADPMTRGPSGCPSSSARDAGRVRLKQRRHVSGPTGTDGRVRLSRPVVSSIRAQTIYLTTCYLACARNTHHRQVSAAGSTHQRWDVSMELQRRLSVRLLVPVLTFVLMCVAGTYTAQSSGAAPATTPCSGWNGHYFNGRKEYNCSFDATSPVRNKYNTQVGTLQAGTNWVICQAKGSTIRLGTSYLNYWWAYTQADNNAIGWVNAVYGSGGDNYGAFRGVPVCSTTTQFTPPIVRSTTAPATGTGAAILRAALSQRGQPYVFAGGNQYGPTNGGFDCSGLVVYAVYQATHKVLYHQAAYQWQHSASEGAIRVSEAALKPGDIVFFASYGTASAPGHVAVYYGIVNGNRTVVDAYDYGVPLGLHSFSQEGGDFTGAIRF